MGAVSTGTVTPTDFFDLVDEVLVSIGRAGLETDEARRSIVEVRPDDRVLQILAGPGSGKTEVIVWRVLYELLVLGTPSERVMVTTFTRKAALEIEARLVERCDLFLTGVRGRDLEVSDPMIHELRVGTIHSLCNTLLAEFDTQYMEAGTDLLDEMEAVVRMARDSRYALRNCADRLRNIEPLVALFRAPWDDGRWPSRVMERADFLLALLGQHIETWVPRCSTSMTPNGIQVVHGPANLTEDLIKLENRWSAYLDGQSAIDFATLQKRFLERQHVFFDEVDHVFVDEFQDTNPIQFAIHTKWLDGDRTRLTAVGDDDQSLYRFRGSDIACFADLEGACGDRDVDFRIEKLERNYRSTKRIVSLSEAYRTSTVLKKVSMPKRLQAPRTATNGRPPRLLEGPWLDVCAQVAKEIDGLGAGRLPRAGTAPAPTVAILLFSTSERTSRNGNAPALDLRRALEDRGLRVYNPRNKTAASADSPVSELFALLSYLIDPVTYGRAGANGGQVEVWASCGDAHKARFAVSAPPEYPVSPAHAAIQKRFRKNHGTLVVPDPDIAPLLRYIDDIRDKLVKAVASKKKGGRRSPRLSLAGLVARLLTFDRYRNAGFTRELFREALFTRLLEAQVAATRLTTRSLDGPLEPERRPDGRIVWPSKYWRFLSIFGGLLDNTPLDDIEVDSFADSAVGLLTFHQAKGLEFDHVYVGLTGRDAAPNAALRTKLFSGEPVRYDVQAGQPVTRNREMRMLAEADREREIYVALTRAKSRLTVIYDPADARPLSGLNPGLENLFETRPRKVLKARPAVRVAEYR